jgi:hypothetical protein
VQPHRGFPRPGPALDDERGRRILADHPVLLGRDRRDDLAHLADTLARDVLDDRLGEVVGLAGLERLVDEPDDAAVLDVEPPPQRDPARVMRRRRVERLGGRRAPVDDEHPVVRVHDDVAADVQAVAADRVDASEVERAARLGVDADPLATHALERLVGVLVDAAVPRARGQPPQRAVERGVRLFQPLLLALKLLVRHGHPAPL